MNPFVLGLAYLPLMIAALDQAPVHAQEPTHLYFPDSIAAPPWLGARQAAQLTAIAGVDVYHSFSFSDQIDASGIVFRNRITDESGKHLQPIHYDHGNGIAVADVDGDGRYDIYFSTQSGANQLWQNLGAGKFEDITAAAGVGVADPIGVSASFADLDNDGDPDLYVTVVRDGNILFENDGNGKFSNISDLSGLDYRGHSSGALFFDYDNDGLLDLFLSNVGVFTTDVKVPAQTYSSNPEDRIEYEYYIGLNDAFAGHLKPERLEQSRLYRNTGNNCFVDVTAAAGITDMSWAGDATTLDANADGWPDLYVLNMQGNDHYYENLQGKGFVDKTHELFPRTPWGSMGIKVFDHNNDGGMDIIISDMHSDMSEDIGPDKEKAKANMQFPDDFLLTEGTSLYGNAFYQNTGVGTYKEVSDQIGAENYWPWGLSVGDLNADGYEDVFLSSSMNYPFRYGINSVLLNASGKKFVDSEFVLGVEPRRDNQTAKPWFELDCDHADKSHRHCTDHSGRVIVWGALGSRASVLFDLDDDGDLDIITNEFNATPMVLISDLSTTKPIHYLKIDLQGTTSNRNGLGATVQVRAGDQTYTKVHDGKSGYLSQSLLPLYFGLGDATRVDAIEIRWPSGSTQHVPGPIAINTLLKVKEELVLKEE